MHTNLLCIQNVGSTYTSSSHAKFHIHIMHVSHPKNTVTLCFTWNTIPYPRGEDGWAPYKVLIKHADNDDDERERSCIYLTYHSPCAEGRNDAKKLITKCVRSLNFFCLYRFDILWFVWFTIDNVIEFTLDMLIHGCSRIFLIHMCAVNDDVQTTA